MYSSGYYLLTAQSPEYIAGLVQYCKQWICYVCSLSTYNIIIFEAMLLRLKVWRLLSGEGVDGSGVTARSDGETFTKPYQDDYAPTSNQTSTTALSQHEHT